MDSTTSPDDRPVRPEAATAARGRMRSTPIAWVAGFVLATVVAVQGDALLKPFFADDFLFLEQVRGRSLGAALLAPDPLGNFLRPVSRPLYFWLVSRVAGESPLPFHAVNLALFVASLLLFFAIVRRSLGAAAAVTAIAFVGLHYAADVPLRWVSGSQDLLAIFFSLGTVHLFLSGRTLPAALCLALAVLSKETAAGIVIVVAAVAYARGGLDRRGVRHLAALVAVTAAWAAWWYLSRDQRPGAAAALSFAPENATAAVAHLLQVTLGIETRLGHGAFGHWRAAALLPAAAAAVAVGVAGVIAPRAGADVTGIEPARARLRAMLAGLAWCLAGVAPVIPVMPVWSAYFYLWALFGAGLLLAAVLAGFPNAVRVVVVAVLVACSANARALDEFAVSGGAWGWQSQVNRHYLDRAFAGIERSLGQMRAARPTLPPRSTVFFANVPVRSGWQTADGPLLRWAYRDSTVRSYFLTQFSREKASRGPLYFLAFVGDSLRDESDSPRLLSSFAYSMLLAERPRAARDALELALQGAENRDLRHWLAWARWAAADTLAAKAELEAAGMRPARRAAAPALPAGPGSADRIRTLLRLRDEAALDAWVHARLAAALLSSGRSAEGAIEAYAYRLLAPEDPDAWRKWASAQLAASQHEAALASLERYLALAGEEGARDAEAMRVAAELRRIVRGDLARDAIRGGGAE